MKTNLAIKRFVLGALPGGAPAGKPGTRAIYRRCTLVAATVVLWSVTMSSAQESKLYTPQPEHEILKRFEGEWRFEKRSAAADGATPGKVGAGKITAELLGGFFVVCKWSGNVYDTNYVAVQTLGYDVDRKAYSGLWIDNLMSYQWPLHGSLAADSNELVITASGPGPTGGTRQFRERYQFKSADSITVVAEMLRDGKWVPFMTTQLTRKERTAGNER